MVIYGTKSSVGWYTTTIDGQAQHESTIISSSEVDIFVNTEQCFYRTTTITFCMYSIYVYNNKAFQSDTLNGSVHHLDCCLSGKNGKDAVNIFSYSDQVIRFDETCMLSGESQIY